MITKSDHQVYGLWFTVQGEECFILLPVRCPSSAAVLLRTPSAIAYGVGRGQALTRATELKEMF